MTDADVRRLSDLNAHLLDTLFGDCEVTDGNVYRPTTHKLNAMHAAVITRALNGAGTPHGVPFPGMPFSPWLLRKSSFH